MIQISNIKIVNSHVPPPLMLKSNWEPFNGVAVKQQLRICQPFDFLQFFKQAFLSKIFYTLTKVLSDANIKLINSHACACLMWKSDWKPNGEGTTTQSLPPFQFLKDIHNLYFCKNLLYINKSLSDANIKLANSHVCPCLM